MEKITDSKIVAQCKMNRNKVSNLLNDWITPIAGDCLNEILLNWKYSIIIDETTNRSKTKLMAILVQISEKNYGPRCMLYGLVDCSKAQDPCSQLLQMKYQMIWMNKVLNLEKNKKLRMTLDENETEEEIGQRNFEDQCVVNIKLEN